MTAEPNVEISPCKGTNRCERRPLELVKAAMEDLGDLLDFGDEFGVFGGDDRLDAIA